MDEDVILYSISLFTLFVILVFYLIRRAFTFFERNKLSLATNTPTVPFGNVGDVIFNRISISTLLWKYHNRMKRKQLESTGFYIFFKPAILVLDSNQFNSESESDIQLRPAARDRILNHLIKNNTAKTVFQDVNDEVNIDQLFQEYIVNVLARIVFGFNAVETDFNNITRGFLERDSYANLKKLFSLQFPKCSFKKQSYEGFIGEILINRKKNDVKGNDILQVLIEEGFASGEISEFVWKFLENLANSSNLLLFLLYELSSNQDIQDELRGEVLRFAKSTDLSLQNVQNLKYLDTVISETLRKYPLQPFTYKVCPNHIKFLSIFGIQHDSQNYINAELFDPDRFSEENEQFIDPSKYKPCGTFKSEDFEYQSAILMMKSLLIQLITNCRFSFGKKSMKNLKFDETLATLKPKTDMWLKVERL